MTNRLIVKVSVFVYTCGPVNFFAGYTRLVRKIRIPARLIAGDPVYICLVLKHIFCLPGLIYL